MTALPSSRPAPVHITDLARPTFTAEAQAIIDGMAAMADYCPLTAEALHEQAAAQTGRTASGRNLVLVRRNITRPGPPRPRPGAVGTGPPACRDRPS